MPLLAIVPFPRRSLEFAFLDVYVANRTTRDIQLRAKRFSAIQRAQFAAEAEKEEKAKAIGVELRNDLRLVELFPLLPSHVDRVREHLPILYEDEEEEEEEINYLSNRCQSSGECFTASRWT